MLNQRLASVVMPWCLYSSKRITADQCRTKRHLCQAPEQPFTLHADSMFQLESCPPLMLNSTLTETAKKKKKLEEWNLSLSSSWIEILLDYTHFFSSVSPKLPQQDFTWIYVCASYPVPQLDIQTERKLACCCCIKYLQSDTNKQKMTFSYNSLPLPLTWHTFCTVK